MFPKQKPFPAEIDKLGQRFLGPVCIRKLYLSVSKANKTYV